MSDASSNTTGGCMNKKSADNTHTNIFRHRLSLRRPKSATSLRVTERQHFGMEGVQRQRTGILLI